jgi:23S rRNA pseudouridine1911/1915/1917 synthase
MTMLGDELVEVAPQSVPTDQPYAGSHGAGHPARGQVHHHLEQARRPGGASGRRQLERHAVERPAAPLPRLANVPRAGIVHRLDKETSGLMVVAKTLAADRPGAPVAGAQHETPVPGAGLGPAAALRHHQCADGAPPARPHQDGGVAKHARQAGRDPLPPPGHGELDRKPVSLVHCRLETGRTHQIRVHCSRWASRWWAMRCTASSTWLRSSRARPCWPAAWAWCIRPPASSGSGRHPPADIEALLKSANIDPALAVIPEMSEEADPVLGDYDEDDDDY